MVQDMLELQRINKEKFVLYHTWLRFSSTDSTVAGGPWSKLEPCIAKRAIYAQNLREWACMLLTKMYLWTARQTIAFIFL